MTAAPALTVEQLDPATLLIDANIRTATNSDKALVASIREVGVLMPIVAVRTAEGDVRVRYGHRRTLAALEADRPTVPVIVTGDDDADDVARIITQWHENEHRAGLSTADKLAAAEQLALLGLSAAQIAKRTHARKADIDQALAASGSALAKGATERWEFLTLAQAAAVAEFDTEPDTVKALVAAAKDGEYDFEHVLQRARDERAEAAQVAEITEQLTTAGVRIIDRPSYADRAVKLLTDLTTPGGKAINPERHTRCPGHAVYIQRGYREARAVYLCTDWKTNGHRDRYSTTSAAPVTGEQASAERREVIANNKAWRSAEAVRRRWITDFLTRKTPPKGAAGYLAGELARGGHEIRRAMETGQPLAATLLGVTGPTRDSVPALVAGTSDARAQVITLALVLAAVEASTSEALWRHSTDTVRRYLAFLTANGVGHMSNARAAGAPASAAPTRVRRRGRRAPERYSLSSAVAAGAHAKSAARHRRYVHCLRGSGRATQGHPSVPSRFSGCEGGRVVHLLLVFPCWFFGSSSFYCCQASYDNNLDSFAQRYACRTEHDAEVPLRERSTARATR